MGWITPKTNWKIEYSKSGQYLGDYFEAADYQRIKNNLYFLNTVANTMYPKFELPEIPDITEASFGYASYIDVLEKSLNAFVENIFDPKIPNRKIWEGNSIAPTAEDLNRIEQSILKIYNVLMLQKSVMPKLALRLGINTL